MSILLIFGLAHISPIASRQSRVIFNWSPRASYEVTVGKRIATLGPLRKYEN